MKTPELSPEICDLIKRTVRSAFIEAFEQFKNLHLEGTSLKDEEFLSAIQAAQFLKIELSTLYSKVAKKELPFSRSGKRKLLFCKKELEDHIASKRAKNKTEIAAEVEAYVTRNNRKKK